VTRPDSFFGKRELNKNKFVMNIFLKSLSATAVLLAVSLSSFAQGGQKNWAVVEFSANLMREAPDYAAELGDQALMGTG